MMKCQSRRRYEHPITVYMFLMSEGFIPRNETFTHQKPRERVAKWLNSLFDAVFTVVQ